MMSTANEPKSHLVIEVNNVSKAFHVYRRRNERGGALGELLFPKRETVHAVKDVSFNIATGEAVGYIGVNGAGKSTTIKMLSGILVPTQGTIRVLGLIPHKQRQRNAMNIGVVFGQRSVIWWDVPVRESMRLLKHMYKIPDAVYQANLQLFNEILELHQLMDVPARELSLGQRMRANLAAAFLHSPQVVYLDEPTVGLDVLVKRRVREFLTFMVQQRNCTLVLTTHDLRDIEEVCSRIIMIDSGHIIFDGNAQTINEAFGQKRTLVVKFMQPPSCINFPDVYCAPEYQIKDTVARLQIDPRVHVITDLTNHLLNTYPITDISIEEPSLEKIVQQVYSRS